MGNPWADQESYGREAAKVESRGEALMLALLWAERNGWTIRCQLPLDPYRIDLAIPEARLAVEVDSFAAHGTNAAMEHDAERFNRLLARGWETLRYPSRRVLVQGWECALDVLGHIKRRLKTPQRPGIARPNPPIPKEVDLRSYADGGAALLAAVAQVDRDDPPVVARRRG